MSDAQQPPAKKICLTYKLAEDSWRAHGRRTYLCDENADRDWLAELGRFLAPYGWRRHERRLRVYQHSGGQVIEIEPGGADTSGHYLHVINEGSAP